MGIIVGDINHDDFQTGLILSAFFYGYICTQIPGTERACSELRLDLLAITYNNIILQNIPFYKQPPHLWIFLYIFPRLLFNRLDPDTAYWRQKCLNDWDDGVDHIRHVDGPSSIKFLCIDVCPHRCRVRPGTPTWAALFAHKGTMNLLFSSISFQNLFQILSILGQLSVTVDFSYSNFACNAIFFVSNIYIYRIDFRVVDETLWFCVKSVSRRILFSIYPNWSAIFWNRVHFLVQSATSL